jgi:hypothetical protein
MNGTNMYFNGYSYMGYREYYFLAPNRYGMVCVYHEIEKNEWWLVHASTRKFPAKFNVDTNILDIGFSLIT